MEKIRNTKLYRELKEMESGTEDEIWKSLFTSDFEKKDMNIPVLVGGLDHIEYGVRKITFHDIGSNRGSNSFQITPEF